jgi:ATP-binding cassette subfamily F protein 3
LFKGKSTLLELLVGNLEPSKGEIYRSHKLRIGYFTQHHVDQLNLNTTSLEHMMTMFKEVKEQQIRAHLGAFGIGGKLAVQKMSTLSGGQKSRVVFAQITFQEPHILILDEPTNHLDFDSIKALTDAISEFEGAVIIVSHDQSLISKVANELYPKKKKQTKQNKKTKVLELIVN